MISCFNTGLYMNFNLSAISNYCFQSLDLFGSSNASDDESVVNNIALPVMAALSLILLTGCCHKTRRHAIARIEQSIVIKARERDPALPVAAQPSLIAPTPEIINRLILDLVLYLTVLKTNVSVAVGPNSSGAIIMGGLVQTGINSTTVMRYPHLSIILARIKAVVRNQKAVSVLVLGPGFTELDGKVLSSQAHEILAAFPKQTDVDVVDKAASVVNLQSSVFGPRQRRMGESVLSYKQGCNVDLLSVFDIQEIRNYFTSIPDTILQKLDLHQKDFTQFKPTRKYDFIFAILSLTYPLGVLHFEAKHKELAELNARYLSALKGKGSLIIDELCYQFIRKKIVAMPDPGELYHNKPVKWVDDNNNAFTSTRFLIPNSSRKKQGVLPMIYSVDEDVESSTNTAHLMCITRLPQV